QHALFLVWNVADPEMTETIKCTRQPYFTLQGNICALLGAKDHLTIFIYDPIIPDPEGLINQGHGNRTAQAIQVREARNYQPARPFEPLSSHYRQQPRRRVAQAHKQSSFDPSGAA